MFEEPGSSLAQRVLAEIERYERAQAERRRRLLIGATAVACAVVVSLTAWRHVDPNAQRAAEAPVAIGSADPSERRDGYRALWTRATRDGDRAALEQLLDGLRDPSGRVRTAICADLIRLHEGGSEVVAAAAAQMGRYLGPVEVEVASTDGLGLYEAVAQLSAEQQIFTALWLIESLGPVDGAPYADFVMEQCGSPLSDGLRARALHTARAVVPNWDQLPEIVRGFLTVGSSDEKMTALAIVEMLDEPALHADAAALLGDQDPSVRAHAVSTVTATAADAADLLLPVVLDEDPRVRAAAAVGLARLGDASHLNVARDVARGNLGNDSSSGDPVVDAMLMLKSVDPVAASEIAAEHLSDFLAGSGRLLRVRVAVDLLQAHPTADAVSLLSELLSCDTPILAVDGARALSALGVEEGKVKLSQLVRGIGCSEAIQLEAIREVGRLGDESFLADLEVVAGAADEEPGTREEANRVIDVLGGD